MPIPTKYGWTLTIDIHGMRAREAEDCVLRTVAQGMRDKDIREVTVVHGYHGGRALLEMVRALRSPAVLRREMGLNNGQTTLILNKKL